MTSTSHHKYYVFKGNFSYTVKRLLKERENWDEIDDKRKGLRKAQFIWKPTKLPRQDFNVINDRMMDKGETCITNHLRGNQVICTKTGIMRSLQHYYKHNEMLYLNNLAFNEVLPTCFLITSGVEDHEFYRFTQRYDQIGKKDFKRERMPKKHCTDNWWLIKPANLNQGRGIKISNSKAEIMQFIMQQIPHSLWVVQKYLEKPLLYKGRKFDIRLWALVTNDMKVYIYKKSYVRTSSSEFTLNSTDDKVTHLTNNCFQVKCDTYGIHEEGNIVTMNDLEGFIKETKFADYSLNQHFFPYAKNHVLDAIMSGAKSFQKIENCFELFGFDLMIDEDLRVWLIECNTNPHLGMPNKMMKTQVPTMLNEMLTIVVDPLYPPKKEPDYEIGNFWKIYEDKGTKKKIRDYELLLNGLYPVEELIDKEELGLRTLGKMKEKFQNLSFQRLSRNRALKRRRRDKGNLSISQEGMKKYNMTEDEEDEQCRSSKLNRSFNSFIMPGKKDKGKSVKKKRKDNYKKQDIENVKHLIYKALKGNYLDEEYLEKLIFRCFKCMANFELYSDDQLETALKSIVKVQQSQFDYLLAKSANIDLLTKCLKEEQLKDEFYVKLIRILENLLSNYKHRWECEDQIDDLINILGEFLLPNLTDDEEIKQEHLVTSMSNILSFIAGNYDRKFYVPGETIINDKLRMIFILRGGLLILVAIVKKLSDSDISSFAAQVIDKYLTLDDWILFKEMLKELQDNQNKPFDQPFFIEKVSPKFNKMLKIALSKASSTIETYEKNISQKMKADIIMQQEIKEVDEEDEANFKDETYNGMIYNKYIDTFGVDFFVEFADSKLSLIKLQRIKQKKDEKRRKRKQMERKNQKKMKKEKQLEARREQIEKHMRAVNQKMRKFKREQQKKNEVSEKKFNMMKEERKKKIYEKIKIREQENQKKRKERMEKEKLRRQNIKNMLKVKRDDQQTNIALGSRISSQSINIRQRTAGDKRGTKRLYVKNNNGFNNTYNFKNRTKNGQNEFTDRKNKGLDTFNNHSTPSNASNKSPKAFKLKSINIRKSAASRKRISKNNFYSSKTSKKMPLMDKIPGSAKMSKTKKANTNLVKVIESHKGEHERPDYEYVSEEEEEENDPPGNFKMKESDVTFQAVRLKNPGSRYGNRDKNPKKMRAQSGRENAEEDRKNSSNVQKEDSKFFKDIVRLNTGYAKGSEKIDGHNSRKPFVRKVSAQHNRAISYKVSRTSRHPARSRLRHDNSHNVSIQSSRFEAKKPSQNQTFSIGGNRNKRKRKKQSKDTKRLKYILDIYKRA